MEKTFKIYQTGPEEAADIAAVIQAVWDQMERQEWFVADDAEYISKLLQHGNGMAWNAVEESSGCLAGILSIATPGDVKENLGRDAGLSGESLKLAAHLDSVAILPDYRGHGLQYRLMREAEAELKRQGFRYLLCTVHPENRFSRDNMVRHGFCSVKIAEKYGGLLREIMMKEL